MTMSNDHQAHVETWLWHLAGWSLNNQSHAMPDAPNLESEASLQALKECHSRPNPPTLEQLEDLLLGLPDIGPNGETIRSGRLPYMGRPAVPEPTGAKGRPPRKNQYDRARESRDRIGGLLKLYVHRKVTMPHLGKRSGRMANPVFAKVVAEVLADPCVKQRKQASEIERRYGLRTNQKPKQPSRSAVQAAIRKCRA